MEIFYHISWRRNSGAGGSCTSTTVASGNLLTGEGSLTCQYGCSGTISSMAFRCTDFSESENWSYGENRIFHSFSNQPYVTIGFTGCCWISPFGSSWNISSSFSMLPRNDTGVINSTPRAITSPVIRVQEGCNHTITIPVTDPDQDIIRCRWALGSECRGICSRIPGAVLDSDSCSIKYEATDGTGYKAVALMIEDFIVGSSSPLSSVALQFLVFVSSGSQDCSTSPVFIPPTITQGTCVAIPLGKTFDSQIVADSLSSSVSVSDIETVSPSGLMKGDVTQIGMSSTYYVNISWTPNDEQQNQTHLFCYTAISSNGLTSAQTCMQLYAGTYSPRPITASPNNQLVHSSNTTWYIRFDRNIERPTVRALITFHRMDTDETVYAIDASTSAEVTFQQPNKLLIKPNHTFVEDHEFYINFERGVVTSTVGCKSGNEPIRERNFWTFTTQDVTPPVIQFIMQPSLSNGNISISWMTNETVVWWCEIVHNQVKIDVNCSEGSWSGYDLSEGKYILQIEATDKGGNMDSIDHAFIIDQTAPTVSIIDKPPFHSNEQKSFFMFECDEPCSLVECNFSGGQEYFCCGSGNFTTPVLQHNKVYSFSVRGTDHAGNKGRPVHYSWVTDFEAPVVYGVSNVSIPCTSKPLPKYTGQPLAVDNITESLNMTYTDSKTECLIRRVWSVEDEASNKAIVIQTITVDIFPTESSSPIAPDETVRITVTTCVLPSSLVKASPILYSTSSQSLKGICDSTSIILLLNNYYNVNFI